MIEAVMFWNELNNPAHWYGGRVGRDAWRIEDPDWNLGISMVADAADAAGAAFPGVERIFAGLSPMDPTFLELAAERGALRHFDAVAGHDFWVDFGPASIRGESGLDTLEARVAALRDATERCLGRPLPVVVSEIGVSSFSGDAFQALAVEATLRALERILDRFPSTRATWYSLFDLPDEYVVTSRYRPDSHGEVRHRKFGLYRYRDGRFRPKPAAGIFARRRDPERIGITQWFRMPWPDPERGIDSAMARTLSYRQLEHAVPLLRELEVAWLRVNITWCDWHCARVGAHPDGLRWFDDLVAALDEFRLLVTVFQAPPQLVRHPEAYDAASVPQPQFAGGFRDAVLEILGRYAPSRAAPVPAGGVGEAGAHPRTGRLPEGWE
jgi:hypothetical protein